MVKISPKEIALLDLLSEGPMHPYKIDQEIKNRSMHEWTEISTSSIYKLLKKLEEKGLVKSRLKQSSQNLLQKIYALTPRGKAKLKESLKLFLSQPEKMLFRIDLATSHLNRLTMEETIDCLSAYRENLLSSLKCYRELEEYLLGCHCSWSSLALAKRPQHLLRGELDWLKEYLDGLMKTK